MIDIENMNQDQIDYELDRMYFYYMAEKDEANRAIEDELFAKEFDLLQEMRSGV